MRMEIDDSSIEHYCDPTDLLDLPSPGEVQLEKRRSTLYKCRSVEDFASSSCHEVSQWNVGSVLRGVTSQCRAAGNAFLWAHHSNHVKSRLMYMLQPSAVGTFQRGNLPTQPGYT